MLRSARRLDRGAKKGIAARPFPIFNDRNHFYPFIRGRRATNQRSASVAGTRGPFLTYKLISCPLKTALSRALLMKKKFVLSSDTKSVSFRFWMWRLVWRRGRSEWASSKLSSCQFWILNWARSAERLLYFCLHLLYGVLILWRCIRWYKLNLF